MSNVQQTSNHGAEDEDQVVFKTPSDASKSRSGAPSVSSKRSSVIMGQQGPFAPSPLSLDNKESQNVINGDQSDAADFVPNFASLGAPNSESPVKVYNGSKGVLGPAAEIMVGSDQPRSRQSSAGDSSFDSPVVPTPAQSKPNNVITGDRGRKVSLNLQGQNGYVQSYNVENFDGGMQQGGMGNNAPMAIPQHALQGFHPLLSPIMSPVMNGLHGPVQTFSPPISSHFNNTIQGDSATNGYGGRQDDYSHNYGSNNRNNGRNGGNTNGRGVNPSAAFPSLNGQQGNSAVAAAAAAAAGFAYGGPTAQANMGYPNGMMSPGLTSPTFQGLPYSPIHAPTPFSPYALPPPLNGANQMYEMLANQNMSPQMNAATMSPGRNQNQGSRYNNANAGQITGNGSMNRNGGNRGGVQQGQRGMASNLNLSQAPYSPPLPAAYAPMSPPPFASFYPTLSPQGTLSPDILQAMNGLSLGQGSQSFATGQAIQNAINQDPSLMALIQQGGGPSANNRKLGLYKTELCRSWEEKGSCKYGEKCQFAHGETEQRRVERHPKYKTEICRTFWVSGSCPYGKRCCFIHTELPASGAVNPGTGQVDGQRNGASPNGISLQQERPQIDGRARSMSTGSDPNDQPSSLLARISARAQANNAPPVPPTNRSSDASPANVVDEATMADAIARAYSAYGLPGGQQPTLTRRETTPPETHTPQPQAPTSGPTLSGFSPRQSSTPTTSGGLGGGHHRVSASVDFGRQGRNLGSDLSMGLSSGGGHHRNPSASSIMPNSYSIPGLSRTPISGQSTPYKEAGTPIRSVAVGSSLLDPSPW